MHLIYKFSVSTVNWVMQHKVGEGFMCLLLKTENLEPEHLQQMVVPSLLKDLQ